MLTNYSPSHHRALAVAAGVGAATIALGVSVLLVLQGVKNVTQDVVSASSGSVEYNVVVSRTNYMAVDDDGLPSQVFERRIQGLGKRIVHTGITQTLITGTTSTLYLTGTTESYFPDSSLWSSENNLEWWNYPLGTVVYTPTAEFALDQHVQDTSLLEALTAGGELGSLGSATLCGELAKGHRYEGPGYAIQAWFSEPSGVRLHYTVTSTNQTELIEECVSADLNPAITETDFELATGTVWATHTLSVSSINAGGSYLGFEPSIITASTTITPVRSYVIERSYVGIYSYYYHDWPGGTLDPGSPLGWFVVQDFEDGAGGLVRILQSKDGETPPLRGTGMEVFTALAGEPLDPGQLITTPLSINPIIRDEFFSHMARWTDEFDGRRFILAFPETESDSYIINIVESLIEARP